MDFTPLLTAVASSIIALIVIALLKKIIGFEFKLWIVPLIFLIGFFSRPLLIGLIQSDKKDFAVHKTYDNVNVILDGTDYSNCTFIDCKLIIKNEKPYSMVSCTFKGRTTFEFRGPASTTLKDLKTIYNLEDTNFKQFPIDVMREIVYPDELFIVNQDSDTLSIHVGNTENQRTK